MAPAKLNLALHVVGMHRDGRHLLESLAVFTRSGDRLALRPASRDGFTISGPFAAPLLGQPNLVTAARDVLRARFPGHECPPVEIRLEKNLPVAAGIGGGSSDAAAALKALCELWQLPADAGRLASAALSLGADLPMCLAARPVLASGIGEQLREVSPFPGLRLVLVNPGVPVATGAVFAALSEKCNPGVPALPETAELAGWIDWLADTRNDLEAPALRIAPSIGDALAALRSAGACVARMSGSGATCYGLFEDAAAQGRAAHEIRRAHAGWFVMEAETRAYPPREGDEAR